MMVMCFRPAEVAGMKNICKKCGTENDPAAKECIECGAELKTLPPLPGMTGGSVSGPNSGAPKGPGGPAAPKAPTAPAALKK